MEDIMHLKYLKHRKKIELKNLRNFYEESSIEYNGNRYQFDYKSQQRLYAAQEQFNSTTSTFISNNTIFWTTENNEEVEITKEDINNIISLGNKRILEVHQKYKEAKEKLEQADTEVKINEIDIKF